MVEKENLVKLTFNYYFIIGKATFTLTAEDKDNKLNTCIHVVAVLPLIANI